MNIHGLSNTVQVFTYKYSQIIVVCEHKSALSKHECEIVQIDHEYSLFK